MQRTADHAAAAAGPRDSAKHALEEHDGMYSFRDSSTAVAVKRLWACSLQKPCLALRSLVVCSQCRLQLLLARCLPPGLPQKYAGSFDEAARLLDACQDAVIRASAFALF